VEPHRFSLLIDENLTPELVKLARSRGFRAVHVNEVNLRTLDDARVARYALEHDMILVTNNMADFRRLYIRQELHPGLIFLAAKQDEAFTRVNQVALFNHALDEILRDEPIQEAILVTLSAEHSGELEIEVTRYELPTH
jgi:predicted nuclease of predicted toxin-antitoxin system